MFILLGKSKSPPPNTYNIPSLFSPNNTTSTFAVHVKGPKTFSFGTGIEAYTKVVINPENVGADLSNPGPGEYNPQHPIG
jgi:hypothetical protein